MQKRPRLPKYRARFTRWFCRKGYDPDGRLPVWLGLVMKLFFSHKLYLYLCTHPVWIEGKRKTDVTIWLINVLMGGEEEK